MSRRPPHQSTPYGGKKLPEPPRMNAASNNPGQSAPADQQQEFPPSDHDWRSPAEIDALAAAQRDWPVLPTNEDWRSYRGKKAVRHQRTDFSLADVLLAGGLSSMTPLPADPYYQQDQSHRSEVRRHGSYGDPLSRGFPSTAPPANLYSYPDQNRQSEILGTGEYGSYGVPPSRGFPSTVLPPNPYSHEDQSRQSEMQRYGSYGDPPYGGFPSTATPPNLSSYQDQNRQGDISGARQHEPRGNRRPRGSRSRAPTVHPDAHQHENRQGDISGERGPPNAEKRKDLQESIAHRLLKPLLV